MAATVAVDMGEVWVSGAADERLTAAGLGACVGVCVYDCAVRLGAMAHVVLPQTPHPAPLFRGQPLPLRPGKCADTAVAFLLDQIMARGARRSHLRAAMAGGAEIFSHSSSPLASHRMLARPGAAPSRLEIGPRNAEAVRAALALAGIPLVAEDTGGTSGRTVSLCIRTGDFWVRRIGGEEHKITSLGHSAPALLPAAAIVAAGREAAYGR